MKPLGIFPLVYGPSQVSLINWFRREFPVLMIHTHIRAWLQQTGVSCNAVKYNINVVVPKEWCADKSHRAHQISADHAHTAH